MDTDCVYRGGSLLATQTRDGERHFHLDFRKSSEEFFGRTISATGQASRLLPAIAFFAEVSMKHKWSADVVNNPDKDFDLSVDIFHGDHHVATIAASNEDGLFLVVYPAPEELQIPVEWLIGVLEKSKNELGTKEDYPRRRLI